MVVKNVKTAICILKYAVTLFYWNVPMVTVFRHLHCLLPPPITMIWLAKLTADEAPCTFGKLPIGSHDVEPFSLLSTHTVSCTASPPTAIVDIYYSD